LSGGQKARVSLARALYSDKDILLLDDILSAVDVHVGEFIVRETFGDFLRGKTVIMPTHAVKFTPYADEIVVMKKGRIVRKGHYKDICNTP
jgi:ABC-type bacteriocin/lantibiotic exporter with double-glycine peptidase domain